MERKENMKLVYKLYIAEIVMLIISAVLNVLILNDILRIKISDVMASVFLIVLMIMSIVRNKHEDNNKTIKIYMLTILIVIIWFLTYMLVLFLK